MILLLKAGLTSGAAVAATALLCFCLAFSMIPVRAEAAQACEPTLPDAEGPYYKPGAPQVSSTGEGLVVSGKVLGAPDCRALPGAMVEWWHAAPSGKYDDAHRGSMKAGPDGAYRFTTDYPGRYHPRPIHIHFKAFAVGYKPITTQLYLKGGETKVEFDIVLAPLK